MTTNFTIGGITTTSQKEIRPEDLAPNNYLTIIWKDVQTNKVINTLDIDNEKAIEYTNQLNSTIDNAISIIYLFPNSRTTITIGNPSIAELILLTSILRSFLFSPKFSISSIKFFNCFIKVFTCKIWP